MRATIHLHFKDGVSARLLETNSGVCLAVTSHGPGGDAEVYLHLAGLADADKIADVVYHHKMDQAADDMQAMERERKEFLDTIPVIACQRCGEIVS